MRSGIKFEQGDIVFVPFPFTNLTSSKKRPVLILSKTSYNKKSFDFVCCGITSNISRTHDHSIIIQDKDLITGTLPKPSKIKVSTIFTLEKSIVVRVFGKVSGEMVKRVKKEFFDLF
jgi:mRNA interferase MazF